MPYVPYRWAVVHFTVLDSLLKLRTTDSMGRRRSAQQPWTATTELEEQPRRVLKSVLNRLAANMPARGGPHGTGTVPVALFIATAPPIDPEWGQRAIVSVLGKRSDLFQTIRLSPGRALHREPFRLPFRILADDQRAEAVQQLQQREWYLNQNREFGMNIEASLETDLRQKLFEREWDIVFTSTAIDILSASELLPPKKRPRLVVGAGEPLPVHHVPRGIACVLIDQNASDVDNFLRELVFGFVHDLPLHEATKAAERRFSGVKATVIADPVSNEYLRIMDALVAVKRESERLQTSLPMLDFESIVERVSRSEGTAERHFINAVRSYKPPRTFHEAQKWLADVRALPEQFANFEQESTGLVPLSDIEAGRVNILALEPELRKTALELTTEPLFANILRRHQNRTFDVAVQRLQSDPVLTALTARTTLRINTDYQLRAHIGQRLPESIVSGSLPPLDPLLPDPEDARGYLLDVVVQGKDFRVITSAIQPLRLPVFGGSEPVYFRIGTPKLSGNAQLRMCVYHQNHMLQSFLLSAEIAEGELDRSDDVLKVELEFSRTDTFADVDEFQPRFLSIGVNQTGATHELLIKSENVKRDYTFFPVTYDAEVQQFRTELAAAVRDPVDPQRPRAYPIVAPGQAPSAQVSDCIRSWVRIGRKLYDSVLNKSDDDSIADALFKLKQSKDQKIQVIRFDENFIFPWMLLYDFGLPEQIADEPPSPVCLGWNGEGNPCNHSFDTPVFCVNGFWGIRHYVEELIRRVSETAAKVPRREQQSVRLVADPQLVESEQLAHDLTTAVGADQFIAGPNGRAQLLDLLWVEPPQRPSMLIILAHMETRQIPGQPASPRLVLNNGEWLTQESITAKRSLFARAWQQPRPIVFLMACKSAASDMKTINDFVSAWNGCGAAAILGTEAVVGSDLASHFALEVGKGLWNRSTLGEVVADYRRALARRGNILAFVFQAIGDVDLTIG